MEVKKGSEEHGVLSCSKVVGSSLLFELLLLSRDFRKKIKSSSLSIVLHLASTFFFSDGIFW